MHIRQTSTTDQFDDQGYVPTTNNQSEEWVYSPPTAD